MANLFSNKPKNNGWFNLDTTNIPGVNEIDDNSAFSSLKLDKTTRLYCFFACFAIGFVLSLVGTIFLFVGFITIFATFYGIGTILSLFATGFLIGFVTQLKKMFDPVRIVAAVVMLASIGLIFVGVFVIDNAVVCIIFVIIQYLAYSWYSLSYIPYARALVKKMIPW